MIRYSRRTSLRTSHFENRESNYQKFFKYSKKFKNYSIVCIVITVTCLPIKQGFEYSQFYKLWKHQRDGIVSLMLELILELYKSRTTKSNCLCTSFPIATTKKEDGVRKTKGIPVSFIELRAKIGKESSIADSETVEIVSINRFPLLRASSVASHPHSNRAGTRFAIFFLRAHRRRHSRNCDGSGNSYSG